MIIKDIHIFSTKDFESYGKQVSSLQKKYNSKLKDWRNKIFAHREHCENEEIQLENVRYDYKSKYMLDCMDCIMML